MQRELKGYTHYFHLWPKQWKTASKLRPLKWQTFQFNVVARKLIPDKPGVYSFVINPSITNHPQRYLCYVGMTERSLQSRFHEYLQETKSESSRPKILFLLNNWKANLEFCCVVHPKNPKQLEARLLTAFLPPFNDQYPARVRKFVKAF